MEMNNTHCGRQLLMITIVYNTESSIMVEKFQLTNAKGETVGLNNFKFMSYSPSGLGVKFENSYNRYQSYFKLTSHNVAQGQFTARILFGNIVSETFDSFSEFSMFLAYQPYTMTYTSDAGVWHREAFLSEMTKSNIGNSSLDPNLLDESFTLEFINNWYNNVKAEYQTYTPDVGLKTFGKAYNTKVYPSEIQEYNDHGLLNQIYNSSFASNALGWTFDSSLAKIDTTNTYNGSSSIKIELKEALWRTPILSSSISINGETAISIGGAIKVEIPTVSEDGADMGIWFYDQNGEQISDFHTSIASDTVHDWEYYLSEGIPVPSGATTVALGVWLAHEPVTMSISNPMLTFGDILGSFVDGAYPVGDALRVYLYGTTTDVESSNSPLVDYAITDITYLN